MTNRTPLERAVAQILDQARIDLGLTQNEVVELAQGAGYPLTQSKVSRALRGTTALLLDDAWVIARAVEMNLPDVIRHAERQTVLDARRVVPIRAPEGGPPASVARRRRPRPATAPRP